MAQPRIPRCGDVVSVSVVVLSRKHHKLTRMPMPRCPSAFVVRKKSTLCWGVGMMLVLRRTDVARRCESSRANAGAGG